MKKNWMLRLGLLAMVLTLVTMPMVSSTYAKYVTEATGTDTARVAKWGVTVSTTATDIFGEAYLAATGLQTTRSTNTPVEAAISVNADSSDIENLLAPGTNGSFTFSLTGKPEVALNLSVASTIALSNDWKVNGSNYQPIKFTLKASDATSGVYYNPLESGSVKFASTAIVYLTASELQSAINSLTKATVAPNTDLALISGATGATGTYTVTWEWPYTNSAGAGATWLFLNTGLYTYDGTVYTAAGSTYDSGKTYYTESGGVYTAVTNMAPYLVTYDEADTALGMAANGTTPSLSISLTITATQIN